MNFLGMGPMEILIVLLVAFIFLGPERMAEAARMLGKATRELSRMAAELPHLDLNQDDIIPSGRPPARGTSAAARPGDDSSGRPSARGESAAAGPGDAPNESESPEPDEEDPTAVRPGDGSSGSEAPEPDEEDPVAFRRSAPAATDDDGGTGAAGEQR